MENWHDQGCRRPDLMTFEDLESCLNCGASHLFSQSVQVDQYIYKPLILVKDFRLITILPGSNDDPIVCKLSLASLSDLPDYYAISYTWADEEGKQENDSSILLDGYRFPVTSNCLAALRQVRKYDTSKAIWIDSVCIDQHKDLEKNHQVHIMPQIYAQAVSVLIYIGDLNADEIKLLQLLCSTELGQYSARSYWSYRSTLKTFLSRRWFSRVWILQEVILAKAAHLLCGGFVLRWSKLPARCYEILDIAPAPFDQSQGRLPAIFQAERICTRRPVELLTLLDHARSTEASDPRDKVFALLGFTFQAEKEGLEADYTKNVVQVYMEVAERLARKFGVFALFVRSSLAGKNQQSTSTNPPDLPLWVPDWGRRMVSGSSEAREMFEASRSENPFAKPLPVQVHYDAHTISFPVCEAEFSRAALEKSWSTTLFFTPHSDFGNDGSAHKEIIFSFKAPDPGSLCVLDATFDETSKASIYLLPTADREGTINFPYGVTVRFARNFVLGTGTLRWNCVDDDRGFQWGHLSPYGLCAAYDNDGRAVLWGLVPLCDIRLPKLSPLLNMGTFKRIELTGDLFINQSQS